MAKQKKEVVEEALEKKLWKAADKLRKNMDAAEYKHVALGLIFLKYISDAFNELYQNLKKGKGQYEGADPEDKNEYTRRKSFLCSSISTLEIAARHKPNFLPLVKILMMQWMPLKKIIHHSKAFYQKYMHRKN